MSMLPGILKNINPMSRAYCPTCKATKVIDFTQVTEGGRTKVKCLTCKEFFWIGGGYGR